mmetsp:Transcript_18906/g.27814  ORF Transcript_18906/g.27814 Transcript_18906/m.27814 type:complete len:213 (-) Transcript_18906:559-1197(-)
MHMVKSIHIYIHTHTHINTHTHAHMHTSIYLSIFLFTCMHTPEPCHLTFPNAARGDLVDAVHGINSLPQVGSGAQKGHNEAARNERLDLVTVGRHFDNCLRQRHALAIVVFLLHAVYPDARLRTRVHVAVVAVGLPRVEVGARRQVIGDELVVGILRATAALDNTVALGVFLLAHLKGKSDFISQKTSIQTSSCSPIQLRTTTRIHEFHVIL